MSSFVNGRRLFAAMIAAFAVLAVLVSFQENRQLAGPRPSGVALSPKFKGQDAVTRQIRSESNVLTRIAVASASDREKASRVGTIVQDYGSFVIVARSKSVAAKNYGLEEQSIETTVNLPGSQFDPVKDPPEGSLRLGNAATAKGKGYYILQFGGTATDEWLKSVRDAGVEVLQYVPHQAYFVYGDSEAIARVANHSRVRWIGTYNADQKLTPVLQKQLEFAAKGAALARGISPIETTKKGTAIFDVAVFARADLDAVGAELQKNFGRGFLRVSRLQHNYFNMIRLELDLVDVQKAVALQDVVMIEPVFSTKNEDERASQILAGNYINSTTLLGPGYDPLAQFGTDGTSVGVSVVDDGIGIPGDGGFYVTALNAVNGPLRGTTAGSNGHGHFNATIIAGSPPFGPLDPLFYNYGKGVAPNANIVSIPRNRAGYTGTDVQVYDDSVTTPGPNGAPALISNNSWGGEPDISYNSQEAVFDGIARDASLDPGIDPITMIFSAGNAGNSGLTHPKAAKNLIAVGNSESIRPDKGGTGADNMDDIAADSSRGPTADGRIKPDVVAPGTAVTGGRSGANTLSGNIDSAHRWSSGTSHAAAHISGVAALFTRWWNNRPFSDRPSPSLIKAALINSAVDLNGENSTAPIPNGTEGWGRPNMKTMLAPGVGMQYINEPVALSETGQVFPLEGSVADGSKPLRVTLVWTDPPGASDPALVNNLDLVVSVGGVEYKGNVFSNGVSVTGGVADSRNNVECVFLPAGIPAGTGLFITVRATALNGDGVILNGDDTDQKYSLVVHNWSGIIAPAFYRLAGQIRSPSGRGIAHATIRITDSQGTSHELRSNHLGYFAFTGVPGGTYTINVTSKRYTFTQRTEPINADITGMIINSTSGSP